MPNLFDASTDRRKFMATAIAAAAGSGCTRGRTSPLPQPTSVQDVYFEAAPYKLELAPGVKINTFAYNAQAPGPTIRTKETERLRFHITNRLGFKDIVHWHGLHIPPEVDGAEEEGTPPVLAGETRTYEFVPRPTGAHWYHTHFMSHTELDRGGYSAQFGFIIIEDPEDPGDYDQEVLLALHHWEPEWVSADRFSPTLTTDDGWEVVYKYAAFNGRMFGHDDPVRVRPGQRVLFRLLNASATDPAMLSLPGHSFEVRSLDGVRLLKPVKSDVVLLGPGERADAVVEMNNPGVWQLSTVRQSDREMGLGALIEYEDATGPAVWIDPPDTNPQSAWDYLAFGRDFDPGPEPDEVIRLTVEKDTGGCGDGFNRWTFNGLAWPFHPTIKLREGKRYRLVLDNQTPHVHPLHLHRHTFELKRYKDRRMSGVFKDTVNVPPSSVVEADFTANNPGKTLFHCHQLKHQDFGLMALFDYN